MNNSPCWARPFIVLRCLGVIVTISLAACGGQERDQSEQPAATVPTLSEQIAALETKGTVPKLDRSSDIAGPDANANGVRDDVEAWIADQPLTEVQRKALRQKAKALQATLIVDLRNSAALQAVGDGLAASSKCGGESFQDFADFYRLSGKIEGMTANTKERAVRYMQYNAARSGSTTTRPSGNACEP
jgi:hypothetical protein